MAKPWDAYFRYRAARERLLRKCKIVGECWVWQGHKRGSYGVMTINGATRNAHRAAWALFVGPVAEGVSVLHSCGNKLCCCPAHLYLGVQERPLNPGHVAASV